MEVMKLEKSSAVTKLTYSGILAALSYVGSLLGLIIPGSLAFDSMPAFFGAMILGPVYGAAIGGVGHLLTALINGFPLTLPLHLFIGVQMALIVGVFGWVCQRERRMVAGVLATILNGPVSAATSALAAHFLGLPFSGWLLFNAMVIPLTIVSFLNVSLALVLGNILWKRPAR